MSDLPNVQTFFLNNVVPIDVVLTLETGSSFIQKVEVIISGFPNQEIKHTFLSSGEDKVFPESPFKIANIHQSGVATFVFHYSDNGGKTFKPVGLSVSSKVPNLPMFEIAANDLNKTHSNGDVDVAILLSYGE